MADQDQVIDRTGIGDDQAHGLKSEIFESLPLLLEIFKRVVLKDAMGLEEAIQLDAGQSEHLAQFHFGDAASPERLEGDAFQRHRARSPPPVRRGASASGICTITSMDSPYRVPVLYVKQTIQRLSGAISNQPAGILQQDSNLSRMVAGAAHSQGKRRVGTNSRVRILQ